MSESKPVLSVQAVRCSRFPEWLRVSWKAPLVSSITGIVYAVTWVLSRVYLNDSGRFNATALMFLLQMTVVFGAAVVFVRLRPRVRFENKGGKWVPDERLALAVRRVHGYMVWLLGLWVFLYLLFFAQILLVPRMVETEKEAFKTSLADTIEQLRPMLTGDDAIEPSEASLSSEKGSVEIEPEKTSRHVAADIGQLQNQLSPPELSSVPRHDVERISTSLANCPEVELGVLASASPPYALLEDIKEAERSDEIHPALNCLSADARGLHKTRDHWIELRTTYDRRFRILTNLINNLTTLMFLMLYVRFRHVQDADGRAHISGALSLGILAAAVLAVVELLLHVSHVPGYEGWMDWVSGFSSGVAMALLFGRMGSRRLGLPVPVGVMLFIYAVIQPGWAAFRHDPNLMMTLTSIALFLKVVLVLCVYWLLDSGVLLFYLRRISETDRDQADVKVDRTTQTMSLLDAQRAEFVDELLAQEKQTNRR